MADAWVYRRPFDYRAPQAPQLLAYASLYAQASAASNPVFLIGKPPVVSTGVFRNSVTPQSPAIFRPSINTGPQGSTTLAFSATGTLDDLLGTPAVIRSLYRVSEQSKLWRRDRYDEAPLRQEVYFTSWQPTANSTYIFTASGTLLDTGQMAGSTTLAFSSAASLISVGVLVGSASLVFNAVANTGNLSLTSGSATYGFTTSANLIQSSGYSGSLSYSFSANAVYDPPFSGGIQYRFSTRASLDTIFEIRETVPYLIGMTVEPALRAISDIHCVSSVVGTTGTVTNQNPEAFSLVPRGVTVTITLGGATNNSPGRRRRGQVPYNSIQ